MATVRVNDIDIYYETQGSGEPMVLIPYLAADQACCAFQVADYASTSPASRSTCAAPARPARRRAPTPLSC